MLTVTDLLLGSTTCDANPDGRGDYTRAGAPMAVEAEVGCPEGAPERQGRISVRRPCSS